MDPVLSLAERSKHDTDNLSSADLLDMKNRLDDELRSLLIARSAGKQIMLFVFYTCVLFLSF